MKEHNFILLRRQNGFISIFFVIVVVFAIMLSGVFFSNIETISPQMGILEYKGAAKKNDTSLQIQTMYFITPTPTPDQTTSNTSPASLNCSQLLNNTSAPIGQPTTCSGKVVSFGVQKKLIPILPWPGSGRPGTCVAPAYIVMHTTDTNETRAEQVYQYFNTGAGGRGSATQFAIGKQGDVIQMTETLDTQVETAYGVGNYSNTISIELTQSGIYTGKSQATTTQYNAALCLVKALMKQYNIPLGQYDYTWSSPDMTHYNYPSGIYGHYQLNPGVRIDPGSGFLRDFRIDLASMQ